MQAAPHPTEDTQHRPEQLRAARRAGILAMALAAGTQVLLLFFVFFNYIAILYIDSSDPVFEFYHLLHFFEVPFLLFIAAAYTLLMALYGRSLSQHLLSPAHLPFARVWLPMAACTLIAAFVTIVRIVKSVSGDDFGGTIPFELFLMVWGILGFVMLLPSFATGYCAMVGLRAWGGRVRIQNPE